MTHQHTEADGSVTDHAHEPHEQGHTHQEAAVETHAAAPVETSYVAAEHRRSRHPVLGGLSGLVIALGALILLVIYGLIAFTGWLPMAIILLAGILIGVLFGLFAPARGGGRGYSDGAPGHQSAVS